ncbi:MAG: PIN domain-containing protein [Actinomycetota bacterium]|nr:PIN domain-containing protein [Actinomycetota bacterium]
MAQKPSVKRRRTSRTLSYVADTHALYWYLQNPARLSAAADAVFRLAEVGGALIIIPAIVVAELYYVAKKQNHDLSIAGLLSDIDAAPGFMLSELGQAQLELLEAVDIDEMHDRLIAAEALARKAAVVTKDQTLRNSQLIDTIW